MTFEVLPGRYYVESPAQKKKRLMRERLLREQALRPIPQRRTRIRL